MITPTPPLEVRLCADHGLTGRTKHSVAGKPIPSVAMLRIEQLDDDAGFYLFYFGKDGTELTDTYHESVTKAMSQAEWEFGVQPSEWKTAPDSPPQAPRG